MRENYIVYGPTNEPNLNPLDEDLNLIIYNNLKDGGNKIALIDAATGNKCTFYDLFKSSCILATNLKKIGLQSGDILCIISENRIEHVISIAAALYIGAVWAPLNPFYTKDELIHCFNITKPKYVICSETTFQRIHSQLDNLSFLSDIILISTSVPTLAYNIKITLFPDLLKPSDQNNYEQTLEPIKFNLFKQTAVVLCSSGTTGLPKGVKLSHANINAYIRGTRSKNGFGLDDTITALAFAPFFHGFGFSLLINTLAIGVKTIMIPRFEETLFLSTIEKYKIDYLPVVPPIMVFLAKSPLVDKYDLSSVKTILCGAAPCSLSLVNQVLNRISTITIRQGYGMTELSMALVVTPHGTKKFTSIGKPVVDIQGKVVDLQTGKSLRAHCKGELCFRGPHVMQGYFNNEKATNEIIDSDGWLRTGDIGYYDEEGYFYMVDRLKELIKYNGYQIPPAELEGIILTLSDVKDVGVIGVPDEKCGELPMAYVVKKPGSNISEKDVIEYVASKVSPQKRLRGGVKFVDAIPKNPSGKILRRVLRNVLQSKL